MLKRDYDEWQNNEWQKQNGKKSKSLSEATTITMRLQQANAEQQARKN